MKRFYCTVCKKVKRVRRYPTNVVQPNAEIVSERVGECTYHRFGRPHPPKLHVVRRVTVQTSAKQTSKDRKARG